MPCSSGTCTLSSYPPSCKDTNVHKNPLWQLYSMDWAAAACVLLHLGWPAGSMHNRIQGPGYSSKLLQHPCSMPHCRQQHFVWALQARRRLLPYGSWCCMSSSTQLCSRQYLAAVRPGVCSHSCLLVTACAERHSNRGSKHHASAAALEAFKLQPSLVQYVDVQGRYHGMG